MKMKFVSDIAAVYSTANLSSQVQCSIKVGNMFYRLSDCSATLSRLLNTISTMYAIPSSLKDQAIHPVNIVPH